MVYTEHLILGNKIHSVNGWNVTYNVFVFVLFFPLQIKSLRLWVMVKNNIIWVNRVFYGKWKGILLAEKRKIKWLPPKKKKKKKLLKEFWYKFIRFSKLWYRYWKCGGCYQNVHKLNLNWAWIWICFFNLKINCKSIWYLILYLAYHKIVNIYINAPPKQDLRQVM